MGSMEARNGGDTPALPALAAVAILTLMVLISIAGYLLLSGQ
jgi:hypothetical protein